MKPKTLWAIITFAVVLSSFLFYWLTLRPANIKKQCANSINWGKAFTIADGVRWKNEDYTSLYTVCLHKRGL